MDKLILHPICRRVICTVKGIAQSCFIILSINFSCLWVIYMHIPIFWDRHTIKWCEIDILPRIIFFTNVSIILKVFQMYQWFWSYKKIWMWSILSQYQQFMLCVVLAILLLCCSCIDVTIKKLIFLKIHFIF